jgi:RNA polymerase sigma-70 factor (ECF subfamily)
MQSFTDEQLIDIYQSNKDGQGEAALDHLYKRYAKRMLNFFYFTLHNDYPKAQDFLQDLFIKIIENHQRFDKNQRFQAWIYRIASNMCKNEFRSNKVIQKFKNYITITSEHVILNDESEKLLRKCINALSQEHRSLIVLRFKLKLSVKEIADIYECPEGTVKSRLFYATKELSKLYKI